MLSETKIEKDTYIVYADFCIIVRDGFENTRWRDRLLKKNAVYYHRVSFVNPHRKIYTVNLKNKVQMLGIAQVHLVTWEGQVLYHSTRTNKLSTTVPFLCF